MFSFLMGVIFVGLFGFNTWQLLTKRRVYHRGFVVIPPDQQLLYVTMLGICMAVTIFGIGLLFAPDLILRLITLGI